MAISEREAAAMFLADHRTGFTFGDVATGLAAQLLLSQRLPKFDDSIGDFIDVEQKWAEVSCAADSDCTRVGHGGGRDLGVGGPPALVTNVAGDEQRGNGDRR